MFNNKDLSGIDNVGFIEELYKAYCQDPNHVDASWHDYFSSWDKRSAAQPQGSQTLFRPIKQATVYQGHVVLAETAKNVASLPGQLTDATRAQAALQELIVAYRQEGHLASCVNPLQSSVSEVPSLRPVYYGLSADLNGQNFEVPWSKEKQTLQAVIEHLQRAYCSHLALQVQHIGNADIRQFFYERFEKVTQKKWDTGKQQAILQALTASESFETFVHTKFLGAKRFSLEGHEAIVPMLAEGIDAASHQGVEQVVIGMAHRGRLNVLVNILHKDPAQIFREFSDSHPPEGRQLGDVKYHLGFSSDQKTSSGKNVHVSLCFNPSHLEFVAPVALGRSRAKQDRLERANLSQQQQKVLTILLHGDAAFIGQGVVQESFNMSALPGYRTGGSIHIIINNQVGFTTSPEFCRSTRYASDAARGFDVPILYVDGDDPEACLNAIVLAIEFRQRFARDIVLDVYGYRRHGHNEGDEPTFTQPVLYRKIQSHKTVRQLYAESLQAENQGLGLQTAAALLEKEQQRLDEALLRSRSPQAIAEPVFQSTVRQAWTSFTGGLEKDTAEVATTLRKDHLVTTLQKLCNVPKTFSLHSKLQRLLEQRREMAQEQKPLDWGSAETLAYASLLLESKPVRLSGQDSGRGTFSHRHAVFHDTQNDTTFVPLQHLAEDQGAFCVWDSPLSETGVLGFDYGYSLDYPEGLVLWEAQFGDFANGAQVIIDQFIASSEQKWNRLSGLVLLLPHGFEGQGAEHSSARLERFLELAAEDNMQITNPTTPAQIYHLLRRQVHKKWRKPLVVMTPKSLLRHPEAISSLEELATGHFSKVIDDPQRGRLEKIKRLILCSGRVYYDLLEARSQKGATHVGLLRLEQLYPWPQKELNAILQSYGPGISCCWLQEEPANMGAWPFLRLQGDDLLLGGYGTLRGISRTAASTPATGSGSRHKKEQKALMEQAFAS